MDNMQIVEFNNEEDCCEDEPEVGEHEFAEVMQNVSGDEFCRIVESEFTPFVGQQFNDIEEAVKFYKMYALACGFDVRRYTTKKWRDGTIKSKLLVCNREGFTYAKKVCKDKEIELFKDTQEGEEIGEKQRRKTKVRRIGCKARIRLLMFNGVLLVDRFHAGHNHELVEVRDREFQKLSRKLHKYHKELIVYNSRLKIGATRTYKMCKEHVNGFENIGASLTDFKNFHRNVKCYINERDGQLFIDRFKSMAETHENFFFDYEVDADGSLIRAIWADGIARRNYFVFGDAVENEHYFDWVFKRFLVAMGGKEPEYIITDQDAGIIKSVKNVFKTARHRFCMWHIMNKVPVKYGGTTKDYPEFIKKLNAIIWDDELEPDEFDVRWGEIMKEHVVSKSAWFEEVYLKRRQWVMAHCRDLTMGSVMRTTQRSESENSFFKKFENNNGTLVEFWMRFESAIDQQRHTQKKSDNDNRHTCPKMKTQCPIERHAARVYTHAVFDEFQEEIEMSTNGLDARGTYEATCSCRKFERAGIICRHIIWIYSSNGVQSIPESYVLRRWRKDAVYDASDGKEIIDRKQIEMTKLWSEIHETVGVLRGKDKDDIETLSNLIRDFREKLSPSAEELTKQQEIEQLLGCKASKEITILPPKHAKNKGSGKRMLSKKAKAEALLSKPKRMCNNCKQMAHHDKRNCPNPFSEHPQQSIESSSDEDEDEEEDDESSE
ncbi:protein FAR1-RELATED SEQUENCE 5-like [Silene latifolia]|uniref:protein FAR1-RELATED SEQUENCE 5-like n=1 Tax=Silene latifolia TaxID=37657 RepID=UPI003D76DAB5